MCALARKNHTEDAMMKKLLACALALLLALPAGALAEAIALNLAEEDALVTPRAKCWFRRRIIWRFMPLAAGFTRWACMKPVRMDFCARASRWQTRRETRSRRRCILRSNAATA